MRRLPGIYRGADVLSNLDIDLIEMTAYAIYRMRQARQSLDQEGLLIQQGDKLIKNPAANIEKGLSKDFLARLPSTWIKSSEPEPGLEQQ